VSGLGGVSKLLRDMGWEWVGKGHYLHPRFGHLQTVPNRSHWKTEVLWTRPDGTEERSGRGLVDTARLVEGRARRGLVPNPRSHTGPS
jgi:hypothetical protein